MIDLVFLLLIFFMVTSRLIVIRQDPDVEIPVAELSKELSNAEGRVIVNVLEDGVFRDLNGKTITEEDIETICRDALKVNEPAGVTTRLHLRGDRRAIVREMKKVVQAAARGGVNQVVFASYKSNPYKE
jgi:biopolymer transport protein ExbD